MKELITKVAKASVYRSGAEVTRRGKVLLDEGFQTLKVGGISRNARTDTARLYSSEGVSCSNLRFETVSADDSRELKELKEKRSFLEKQVEIRNLQIDLWKKNGDFSGRDGRNAGDVRDYIEKLSGRIESLGKETIALRKEIEDLKKKEKELSLKLRNPVMTVDITAPRQGEYPFELRVFEYSASWYPLYEIHTDGEGPLDMSMRASVSQQTGEDWDDVDLTLISGNPSTAGTIPVLDPVHLDIYVPQVMGAGMAGGRMLMSKAAAVNSSIEADYALDDTVELEEVGFSPLMMQEASVSRDDTYTEYALPGKKTVKTDKEGTVADLQALAIPAQYRISSVPKLDPAAYLVAAVKPSDIPVSSRIEASIYYKGVYTGKIYLDPDLTEDEIEITLGKEERISITRREVMKKTSNTLLKAQKVTEYAYETKISNNSPKEIEITVKDQIPVSRNKDITVDVTELSGADLDRVTGIMSKKYTLAGGSTETFRRGYKQSSPNDKATRKY